MLFFFFLQGARMIENAKPAWPWGLFSLTLGESACLILLEYEATLGQVVFSYRIFQGWKERGKHCLQALFSFLHHSILVNLGAEFHMFLLTLTGHGRFGANLYNTNNNFQTTIQTVWKEFVFCFHQPRMRRTRWWRRMSGSSKYVNDRRKIARMNPMRIVTTPWWTLSSRNGTITSCAGTRRNTRMLPPSVFPQRSSGGPTSSYTTSKGLLQ